MVTATLLFTGVLAQSLGAGPPAPTITNLGLAVPDNVGRFQMRDDRVGERWIALQVSESAQGSTNLNGDADAADTVVFVHDRLLGTTVSTGLATEEGSLPFVHRSVVGVLVNERANGFQDLNGDGDRSDDVACFYDAASGSVHNTRVVTPSINLLPGHPTLDRFSLRAGGTVVIEMSEDGVVPLNGDADLEDAAMDAWLLGSRSGLLPVRPTSVRRSAGPLLATAYRGSLSNSYHVANETFLVMGVEEVQEGRDMNGDGDVLDPDVLSLIDLGTGARRNLGLAGNAVVLSPALIAFRAGEGSAVADLNGDGDLADQVLHVYEPATGSLTNLGFAIGPGLQVIDGHVLALVSEADQGNFDLNGDGDLTDQVAHVFAPGTWAATNLGLAAQQTGGSWHKGLFMVFETEQGSDLNGDGDLFDQVLHACHLASASVTNVGVAVIGALLSDERFVRFYVQESAQGADFNLDGDLLDNVVALYDGLNDTFHNTACATFTEITFFPRVNETESGAFLFVYEAGQGGMDLNGDGDSTDIVLAHWQSPGPFASNLGLCVRHEQLVTVRGKAALVEVYEPMQKEDLNGDGDELDTVAHLVVLP